ncbi:THAP domain-containing protein 1-like isoform X2 [Temnothorax curvispinosus]|uniref:THAP domain-containing protein 1-like isoform X2 n=1 Tax=Temnothorax curvispinosus TaxID=300111 RepID=A0A6J1PW52_9HYME|nr:THAP domain-containing protein 1-like isoform X2 [Temnothorax curvispinosus]
MCKRKYLHQSPYSFFRFPLEKAELLNKWLRNMNLLNWRPAQTSRLCSNHFEAFCLRKVKEKYWALKENSIPTIFTSSDYSLPYETPGKKLHDRYPDCQIERGLRSLEVALGPAILETLGVSRRSETTANLRRRPIVARRRSAAPRPPTLSTYEHCRSAIFSRKA